jgi:superfamily II DNA or RNA helicase
MLNKIDWPEDLTYNTGSEYEPFTFFLKGLTNSVKLDLLLGYFSTSAINSLSVGFANFLYRGGTVRLIINDVLSSNDKSVLDNTSYYRDVNNLIDLQNLDELYYVLNSYGKHFFNCISWLIAKNRIQIKIIKPLSNKGLSHFKSGVFSDGRNKVSFKGSCNFTARGLLDNLENLDVFLSWSDDTSFRKISSQEKYFDIIWNDNADFCRNVDINDIIVSINNISSNDDINNLLIQENDLLQLKAKTIRNNIIRKAVDDAFLKNKQLMEEPRFPYPSGPRIYQTEAYSSWIENGYRGIFAMATGTGKTITSLNCLLNEYLKCDSKYYRALILVPTITLIDQWETEVLSFNFRNVLKISSRNRWKKELNELLFLASKTNNSYIIICTYASLTTNIFKSILPKFGKDVLLICDEAHNLGAQKTLELLPSLHFDKVIGLSATPTRVYDDAGSKAIEDFFGDKEPYVYNYPMSKAIKNNILCSYDYYPVKVELTYDEMSHYNKLSKDIARLMHINDGNSDNIEKLLLKRKRILHKASNKKNALINILKKVFLEVGDLKFSFVYVPEGIDEELNEVYTESHDEHKLIDSYCKAISKVDKSIIVNKFVSGQRNRDEILKQFEEGIIHVIASMKCLDEGIDIPRAKLAVFCSSTSNPRQFIQRRGRILRKHPNKQKAVVYDLIALPDFVGKIEGGDTYNIERNLVRNELERVMYFASISDNPYYSESHFKDVCYFYKLNLYTIQAGLGIQ